jgi:hypothetical protein
MIKKLSFVLLFTFYSAIAKASSVKLWLDSSFILTKSKVSKEDNSINVWHVNNEFSNKLELKSEGLSINKPKYSSNAINSLPAVEFSGNPSLTSMFFRYENSSITKVFNGEYTLFIVDKPKVETEEEHQVIIRCDMVRVFTVGPASSGRIITFSKDKYGNRRYFENKKNKSNDEYFSAPISSIKDECVIGSGYNGYIGEIVLIDRVLNDNENKEIYDYLADKWSI